MRSKKQTWRNTNSKQKKRETNHGYKSNLHKQILIILSFLSDRKETSLQSILKDIASLWALHDWWPPNITNRAAPAWGEGSSLQFTNHASTSITIRWDGVLLLCVGSFQGTTLPSCINPWPASPSGGVGLLALFHEGKSCELVAAVRSPSSSFPSPFPPSLLSGWPLTLYWIWFCANLFLFPIVSFHPISFLFISYSIPFHCTFISLYFHFIVISFHFVVFFFIWTNQNVYHIRLDWIGLGWIGLDWNIWICCCSVLCFVSLFFCFEFVFRHVCFFDLLLMIKVIHFGLDPSTDCVFSSISKSS